MSETDRERVYVSPKIDKQNITVHICRLSSSVAAYITGGITVPGAAGGIIISGIIVKVKYTILIVLEILPSIHNSTTRCIDNEARSTLMLSGCFTAPPLIYP